MTLPGAATLLVLYAVKATLLLAAAAAASRMLRRHSASLRHAVWAAGICGTLILPIASMSQPPFSITVANVPEASFLATVLVEERHSAEPVATRSVLETSQHASSIPRASASPERAGLVAAAIFIGWLLGAALVALKLLIDVGRTLGLIRRARRADDASKGRVRVLESTEIAVPMAAGIFRPVILVPSGFLTREDLNVQAVLAHETAHIRRHDSLLQVLARIMCACHWFNPLAWYAARAMRAEAERACDDRALDSGVATDEYAESLLVVAQHMARQRSDLVAPMATTALELESRLVAILTAETRRQRCSLSSLTGVASAAVLVVSAISGLQLEASRTAARAEQRSWRDASVRSEPLSRPAVPRPQQRVQAVAHRPAPASAAPGPPAQPVSMDSRRVDERIPIDSDVTRTARGAIATLDGPDAVLARKLFDALEHTPRHYMDLVADRAAWSLSQAQGNRLIDPLIDALQASDWREAAYAAWALSLSEQPRVVPALVQAMSHAAWRVRANAAAGLAEFADRQAAGAMRDALQDTAWQVRVEAVKFFGRLGDESSIAMIRSSLNDPHIAVRQEAQAALRAESND